MKIAILGAGAWGTALAVNFSDSHQVTLWCHNSNQCDELSRTRRNQRYLPDIELPQQLSILNNFTQVVNNSDLLLIATPVSGLRETLNEIKQHTKVKSLLWVCKGFEEHTSKFPHQIVSEVFNQDDFCGILSGPSFAIEVARKKPTALTLASKNASFSQNLVQRLHSSNLRIYSSTDLIGVEVGAAVKNVMAIAVGISDGLNYGHNARAALITRGLAEMTRLGVTLGGRSETFMGLTGVGDLILTCTVDLSRNRRVGLMLAHGKKLNQILTEIGHVAEGVQTACETLRLAKLHHVEMPITKAVCEILFDNTPVKEAVEKLLNREPKSE